MPQKRAIGEIIADNFGFKVIAFLITLVLWLTILGRREFVYLTQKPIEIATRGDFVVVGQTADIIDLKIAGPRAAIKRFIEVSTARPLPLEIKNIHEGLIEVEITPEMIELPTNIKLLSIKPSRFRVEVLSKENYKKIKEKQ